MWHVITNISDVPLGRDLRLAVINSNEVHALVFPCRRKGGVWVNAETGQTIEVHPTHWQYWSDDSATRSSEAHG
jgi:hypothetical protein